MATTDFTCPHCHRQLTVLPTEQNSQWSQVTALQSVSNSPLSNIHGFSEYQRVTPVGKLEPRDILTSIMDAGIAFVLFSVGSSTLFWWAELPLLLGPITGFMIGCARYFGGVQFAKGLLTTVETIIKEITPDPEPEPKSQVVVNATIEGDKRKSWQFADLPGDEDNLVKFAKDVISGQSFSERSARDNGLTQDEFYGLRDAFIERGWAEWKHPKRRQQGVKLTRNGRAILRAIGGHQ